jgi:hypothetical protein
MRHRLKVFLILFPAILMAESSPLKGAVALEGGTYVTQIQERLPAPSGTASQVSTLAGFFRLRTYSSLGKNWYFEPGLGTMVPWRSGVDGSTKTFMTHLNLDLAKHWRWFSLRLGPGIFWQWILSTEEEVVLNNGSGHNSFYTPGDSSSIFLVTADAGLGFQFSRAISLNLDLYVLQAMSQARRCLNGTVTLGWRL